MPGFGNKDEATLIFLLWRADQQQEKSKYPVEFIASYGFWFAGHVHRT